MRPDDPTRQPLRLWPGLVAATVVLLCWFVLPAITPAADTLAVVFTALGAAVAVAIWWLFFSRAPWVERVGAILLAIVGVLVTRRFIHTSIDGAMMGVMLPVYSIPVLSLALVAGAVIGRGQSTGRRRATMAGAILVACAAFTLIRTDGLIYGMHSDLRWRWTPTPEERLLAGAAKENEKDLAGPAMSEPGFARAEWPGFRGPARDSVIRGVKIDTDWVKSPPIELWRRPIGPGWSSFAVQGKFIYTQEQRGDDEIVSCYDITTGAPVWRHRDAARFWESNAGAGPRGTPTLDNGRVYTLGATGIVNALDARTGAAVWSRNAAADTGAALPLWAFSGSPLVVNDVVIVATSGRLVAYEIASGTPRWTVQTGGGGYSSPQLATFDGVEQVLLLNGSGAASVAPVDGKLLWKHEWTTDGIVQPAVIAGSDVLIGSGSGGADVGMRRIAVKHAPFDAAQGKAGAWIVEARWTTTGLKPYFNDFVVNMGHAFGFDGTILACIDLADGARKWKGGRYGQGQMLVLPDQDLLLVLAEDGDLALVSASPDRFTELARYPAIEGKTWNHPVLVGDVLLVRNAEEMAAFRLK